MAKNNLSNAARQIGSVIAWLSQYKGDPQVRKNLEKLQHALRVVEDSKADFEDVEESLRLAMEIAQGYGL